MLTIANYLVGCGHEVSMLAGSRFAKDIEKTGAKAHAYGGLADFDDRVFLDELPEMQLQSGIARIAAQALHLFSKPMTDQYQAVQLAIDEIRPSVVVYENLFTGILPLLQTTAKRPAVVSVGTGPLIQESTDAPSFWPGMAVMPGFPGRLRNRILNTFVNRVIYRNAQRHINLQLGELGLEPISRIFADYIARNSDQH